MRDNADNANNGDNVASKKHAGGGWETNMQQIVALYRKKRDGGRFFRWGDGARIPRIWTAVVGEEFQCQRESGNQFISRLWKFYYFVR